MSDHPVTGATDPIGGLPGLLAAVSASIRPPDSTALAGTTVTYHFNVDLTAAQATAFADLVLMARFAVVLTLAEWQQVKPDAANLKAYVGIASPTLAQTAAAVKSIARQPGGSS